MRFTWALGVLSAAAVAACAPTPVVEDLAVNDMVPRRDVAAADAPLFTVYFDVNSAVLTPEATAILDRLARDPARAGWTRITLTGHADRSGSRRLNQQLSAARVEAVRRHLVEAGVPAALVVGQVVGDRDAQRRTDPDDRRVEIFVSG